MRGGLAQFVVCSRAVSVDGNGECPTRTARFQQKPLALVVVVPLKRCCARSTVYCAVLEAERLVA